MPRDPLPRLLVQISERLGGGCTFTRAASRPWASALFEGRRHLITVTLGGLDAKARCDRFAQRLANAEWILPAYFVADITIDERRTEKGEELLELSALTIQDW